MTNISKLKNILSSDWGIYITRGGVVGANLISLLLIALVMEPVAYGEFVFMFSAALTLSAIVSLGAPNLLLRELSAELEIGIIGLSRDQVLKLVVVWPTVLLVAVAAIILALEKPLNEVTGQSSLSSDHIILIVIVAGLINLINVLAVLFRIRGYTGTAMAFRDAGPQTVMLTATCCSVLFAQPQPLTVFSIGIFIFCSALFWSLFWLRHVMREQFDKLPEKNVKISISGFWGTTVANMGWTQVDILIGGLFLSASDLGHYQIFKRLANFANMPQIVANWAIVVGVGRAFAEKKFEKIQTHVHRAHRLSALPLILINLFILGFAPVLVSWFDISMTTETWTVLLLLLVGSSVNVLFGPNYVVASQCNLEKTAFLSRLIGLASCAILIFVVEPDKTRFVATAYVCGIVIANTWLWQKIRVSLMVDTSIFALLKGT